jgi:hypothetical protein
MEAARQSKIAEMAEANESEKGVMFGGEKTWLIKIPISDIKIGPRFKVESSNRIPRSNYERNGDEILVHWFL